MKSGTFYDPKHPGHGLQVHIGLTGRVANATWYCHDLSGQQCWLLIVPRETGQLFHVFRPPAPRAGFPIADSGIGKLPPLGKAIGHASLQVLDENSIRLVYKLESDALNPQGFSPSPPAELQGEILLTRLQ